MKIKVYNSDNSNSNIDISLNISIDFTKSLNYINYGKKEFNIKKLDNISNKDLEKIYIGKYIEYGIIPYYLLINNNNNNNKYYIKNNISIELYNLFKNNTPNILLPEELLNTINTYLQYCSNYFNLIKIHFNEICEIEKLLIDTHLNYIKNNNYDYITNYTKINLSLEFLNLLKNDIVHDMNYLYFNLYNLKYQILFDNNLLDILNKLEIYIQFYNDIGINFEINNNIFKINEGIINLEEILYLLKNNINNDSHNNLNLINNIN